MNRIILLLLLLCPFVAFSMPHDSIGTKVINGKSYTLHKVSKGEGVYGISRRYGVPASEVFAANEGSEQTIKIGQILMIPRGSAPASSGSTGVATTKTEKIYHTVEKGQTLSSIARQHNTSVSKIKELNSLSSDNIRLGQKLVVGEKTTTVAAAVNKPAEPDKQSPRNDQAPGLNDPSGTYQAPKNDPEPQKNVVVNPPDTQNDTPKEEPAPTVNTTYSTIDGDEITETGMAMVSTEGELGQERSFILHPTAKIGTIVMITNSENNNTVFARVVGNCPKQQGVVLKMSKIVASKLGASGQAEVKVSYAK